MVPTTSWPTRWCTPMMMNGMVMIGGVMMLCIMTIPGMMAGVTMTGMRPTTRNLTRLLKLINLVLKMMWPSRRPNRPKRWLNLCWLMLSELGLRHNVLLRLWEGIEDSVNMLDLNPIKCLEDHVSFAMALIMLGNVLTDLIRDITTPRAMASVKARATTWLSMRSTPTSSPPRAKARERRARMPIGWTLSFGPKENPKARTSLPQQHYDPLSMPTCSLVAWRC